MHVNRPRLTDGRRACHQQEAQSVQTLVQHAVPCHDRLRAQQYRSKAIAVIPLQPPLPTRSSTARERFTFVVLDGGTAGQHLQLGAKQRRRKSRGGRIKGPASIGIGNAIGLLHGGQGEDR